MRELAFIVLQFLLAALMLPYIVCLFVVEAYFWILVKTLGKAVGKVKGEYKSFRIMFWLLDLVDKIKE